MERRPTPIVIVSRSVSAEDLESTMEALRAGAVSAVEKPGCRSAAGADERMRRLCRELAVMSQVKVVRQRFNRPGRNDEARMTNDECKEAIRHSSFGHSSLSSIVGIVASTGGPRALECVLSALGADFSLPIVVVQHITPSFQKGFVNWLARVAPQRVEEANHGEKPLSGCVYVAPAAKHLVVARSREQGAGGPSFRCSVPAPCPLPRAPCRHCPSGTLLLESLAGSYGSRAVGVVLTGMGDDGAQGLLAVRRAGGYTITEDDSTAVVNGMPQAARQIGASCVSLPLESIGTALQNLVPLAQEIGA
jgi:two-component system chemotaxis response regulator CheB